MITFKQFISEKNTEFEIEQFIKDCSYALGMMDKKHLLYRGIMHPNSQVAIDSWKPRAKPTNTPMLVHHLLNDIFEDMFGARIRDWLFCAGETAVAAEYTEDGDDTEIFAIFPIGKFEWIGSLDKNFEDMTRTAARCMELACREMDIEYQSATTQEKIKLMYRSTEILKGKLDKSTWKHNTDLRKLLSTENEIMIKCGRYYRISLASAEFKQIMGILK